MFMTGIPVVLLLLGVVDSNRFRLKSNDSALGFSSR